MSENTGGGTWSNNDTHLWGSCGYQVPGTEVRVFKCEDGDINKKTECPQSKDLANATEEEQGEVCMRGRHIMLGCVRLCACLALALSSLCCSSGGARTTMLDDC